MEQLTKKQFELFHFILKYMSENEARFPSHLEIAENLEISVGGPTAHLLSQLVEKGYIEKVGDSYKLTQ